MSRNSVSGFREVFSVKKGRRLKRTPLRSCIHCGTNNDTRKTSYSKDGSGLVKTSDAVSANVFAVYDEAMDEKAGSGCKFCGSLNWQNTKPNKLPDDKFLPATGWRRKRR